MAREYADEDVFVLDHQTPDLSYLGQQIWKSKVSGTPSEGWNASAPFVDHWKLARKHGPTIYLDEINWWPLIFSAKCRQIVAEDAKLIGPSKDYIDKCSRDEPDSTNPGRFRSYPWIEESEAQKLRRMPARGALINRKLKNYVLDWGFTDAVLSVGPMRAFLLEGIRQLVLKSVNVTPDGSRGTVAGPRPNQEFVIVSHSLGSYLIFSALDLSPTEPNPLKMEKWKGRFQNILARTSMVYFFANQLRLLELANLDAPSESKPNMAAHLEEWGRLRRNYLTSQMDSNRKNLAPPQIISWSDPSDLLTWNVPELRFVVVKNRTVKNSIHWLWLLEWPSDAHGNYAMNNKVINVMLKPTP